MAEILMGQELVVPHQSRKRYIPPGQWWLLHEVGWQEFEAILKEYCRNSINLYP